MSLINKSIEWVSKQLNKFFSKLFSGKSSIEYNESIMHAAQSSSYVETVSNKADSLHLSIKRLYEDELQESFLDVINKLSPLFRKGKVRLAIDRHEEGYYGKMDSMYLVGTSYNNKSYRKAYEYITISLLTGKKEERLHLYALPWHIGQDLVDSVAILLGIVKRWFNKIEVVEFDRGFYKKELVYWLDRNKIPYLIHVPKHGKTLNELIKKTKSFYRGKYRQKFYLDKSSDYMETNLYVCKDIEKKDWLFVSSIWFNHKWQVRNLYRNRWQIETNYAINSQNRIMSKSTKYMIRYFYFLCDILLQVLWRLCELHELTFKEFLRLFVVDIETVQKMKPNVFNLKS